MYCTDIGLKNLTNKLFPRAIMKLSLKQALYTTTEISLRAVPLLLHFRRRHQYQVQRRNCRRAFQPELSINLKDSGRDKEIRQ